MLIFCEGDACLDAAATVGWKQILTDFKQPGRSQDHDCLGRFRDIILPDTVAEQQTSVVAELKPGMELTRRLHSLVNSHLSQLSITYHSPFSSGSERASLPPYISIETRWQHCNIHKTFSIFQTEHYTCIVKIKLCPRRPARCRCFATVTLRLTPWPWNSKVI